MTNEQARKIVSKLERLSKIALGLTDPVQGAEARNIAANRLQTLAIETAAAVNREVSIQRLADEPDDAPATGIV